MNYSIVMKGDLVKPGLRFMLHFNLLVLLTWPILADSGDIDKGENTYRERCIGCHGEDGDGLGPGAERLLPPPRDFTSGMFKFMTTAFDEFVPQDDDIYRMVRNGMPGTAMPGWSDVLPEEEIWNVIAYIKTFSGYDEEQPGPVVDYGNRVETSEASIARGKELFLQDDRCSECHGVEGKGDAKKRLLGDNSERTWPRNLTKPWTFRASNGPRDIFTRISTGIPGTQMPSFADEASTKKLAIEDRWHVANYVQSIAKTVEVVNSNNTVIKSVRVEGSLPATTDDPRWQGTPQSTFFLVPQIIAKERHFTPTNDTITVRSLYNLEEIAVLLEWDDRTKSIPGDDTAEKIAVEEIAEDGVAIQLPVSIPDSMEKPYFGMGDVAHPVNIWHWKSGTTRATESVSLLNAVGFSQITRRDTSDLDAIGSYENGTWKVLFKRRLQTGNKTEDLQFVEGAFIPIALAAWDGSANESGSKHTMTTWYWLLLESSSIWPSILSGLFAALAILAVELWWLHSVRSRQKQTG